MKTKILSLTLIFIMTFMDVSFSQESKRKERKRKAKLESQTLPKPIRSNTSSSDTAKSTGEVKPARPVEVLEEKPVKQIKVSENEVKPSAPVEIKEEVVSEKTEDVIKPFPNGSVNWSEQYIEAKGSSVLDTERFKNPAQARAMATRGAVVVAQRNLLEIIKGVNVTSETTVQDMITTSDFIYTRIDGVVKGAQQVGEAIEKNGLIEVTMRVPLYDKNGLAPAVSDKIPSSKRMRTATEEVLKEELKPEPGAAESLANVAFNLAGKKFDPSMFPVIVDEKNNIVFDYSKIYDPKSGKFPKLIETSASIMKELGYDKGVKVLDVLNGANGKLVIDNKNLKKVNWGKIGTTAAKIGKFLLMLI